MDSEAVEHAKSRLRKAEKAVEAFRAATEIREAEDAWTDYLLAVSTIYSKLQEGAKGHPKSDPWFGKKKRDRKDDPLLRYLHFARNSDEHGIRRVASVTGPNRDLVGRPLKFNERLPMKAQKWDATTDQPDGPVIDVVIAGPTLKPVKVRDSRFADECEPPETHMGKEILYRGFVDHLAETALPYLRLMVEEAEALSKAIAK